MRGASVAVAAALMVWVTACAGAGARAVDEGPVAEATPGAIPSEPAAWSVQSSSGFTVRLSPRPNPPVAGRVRFLIAETGEGRPTSVDLVSPTMPMHGVVRFPVISSEEGRVADVEIPMEGDWALYVNFDDGVGAAEVRFTVAAADAAAVRHH